jgi:major membrane immunogen (membrane-anchored lipoprotein)
MKFNHLLRGLALALCSTPLLAACGADDEIDNAVDCDSICGRYAECFDDSYDTGSCEAKCRDNASGDEDYEAKVDACDDCIDNESCAAGLFECSAECVGIVP